ncbi:hypothetical protein VUR80DRAFT_4837 [Thermomyces stellatus]
MELASLHCPSADRGVAGARQPGHTNMEPPLHTCNTHNTYIVATCISRLGCPQIKPSIPFYFLLLSLLLTRDHLSTPTGATLDSAHHPRSSETLLRAGENTRLGDDPLHMILQRKEIPPMDGSSNSTPQDTSQRRQSHAPLDISSMSTFRTSRYEFETNAHRARSAI